MDQNGPAGSWARASGQAMNAKSNPKKNVEYFKLIAK